MLRHRCRKVLWFLCLLFTLLPTPPNWLFDHILTNIVTEEIASGVIVSDISDHFPVFIELPSVRAKNKTKNNLTRNFSKFNIEKFRVNLSQLDWSSVSDSEDIDISYGNFWDTFKTLFDLNFPLTKSKFNKNFHKINSFMTKGLLISRMTKINLHKKSINDPSTANLRAYRRFHNIYTKTLRARKNFILKPTSKKLKAIQRRLGI